MSYVTRAVIHRDHLIRNLNTLSAAANGAQTMCMVKANAYGHGLVEVAQTLTMADSFGVARVEEAAALREAGIRQPIVLLEGVFDQAGLDAAAALQCELVVHQSEQLAQLQSASSAYPFIVWIKVDSGMNRLGFAPVDLPAALDAVSRLDAVADVRLMSHFASADVDDGVQLRDQLDTLAPVLDQFDGAVSLRNSPATLRKSSPLPAVSVADDDWIRPGIALYGISPFAATSASSLGLRPAMDFETRLIAVRELEPGDRVGYGGRFIAPTSMRLGIAAAGYGDGYPRRAPDGTPVLVDGQRASIAGRVSMDMLSIDLSSVPEARIGSTVRLWGGGLPVEEVAACVDTIGYELVTRVSERVVREYV